MCLSLQNPKIEMGHNSHKINLIFQHYDYKPQEIHVENWGRHKAEENVDEGRDEDSCQTSSLNMFKMVPELGEICCWDNTVILESLKMKKKNGIEIKFLFKVKGYIFKTVLFPLWTGVYCKRFLNQMGQKWKAKKEVIEAVSLLKMAENLPSLSSPFNP